MPYSFKLLVHEIKPQTAEPIYIEEPILAITFANYPKIFIKGKGRLQTQSYEGVFQHGKSALLQLEQDRLESILQEQPLELLLLNGPRILAGGRVKLDAFIHTIHHDIRFKRGNFHLLDQFGKPYALADISISIHHLSLEPPAIPAVKKLEQDEPVPDEIVYKKKANSNKPIQPQEVLQDERQGHQGPQVSQTGQPPKDQNKTSKQALQLQLQQNQQQQKRLTAAQPKPPLSRENLNAQPPTSVQLQTDKKAIIQEVYSTKKPSKKQGKAQSLPKKRPVSAVVNTNNPKKQQKPKVPGSPALVKAPEEPKDIPIEAWANGYHCPPPMVLDKKVYVHQVFNAPEVKPPVYVRPSRHLEMAVQTDPWEPPQQALPLTPQHQPSKILQTQNSEGYQDDFESFSQSQQLVSQAKLQNSTRVFKKANSIVEQDEISESYPEDFEQMSLSYRKSQSGRSYIQEFDSYSQSRR